MKKMIATTYSKDLSQISLKGEIQSIYNRTVNVVNTDKKIYTICQEITFRGPRQIRISPTDFKRLNFKKGNHVDYSNGEIQLGNETIVMKDVPIFQLNQLRFPETWPNQISTRISEIEADLIQRLDTVGFFMKPHKEDIMFITNSLLKEYASMFVNAVEMESKKKIEESVKHLIGLGFGLTPSGDDFLTGFALIINSQNYPIKHTREMINESVKKHMKDTNIISKNQLELALAGRSLEPILGFIDFLYNNRENQSDLKRLVSTILKIGSSSGSDILFGILAGFNATNEKLTTKIRKSK